MRRVLAGASLVLAAAFLTSCGGDDPSDAPDDASTEDFCEAFEGGPTDGEPSEDDLQEWADELSDAGTPEGIDDDAREGFELFVEALQDVDPDDFGPDSDLNDIFDDEDDAAKVTAFLTYYGTECADIPDIDDMPTE